MLVMRAQDSQDQASLQGLAYNLLTSVTSADLSELSVDSGYDPTSNSKVRSILLEILSGTTKPDSENTVQIPAAKSRVPWQSWRGR